MIILNDLHLSANRASGTTVESSKALNNYSFRSLSNFLYTTDEDVLIAGDVFDSWNTNLKDILTTYYIFKDWLTKGYKLIVMAANHDLSTDSNKYGSLQFLMSLLEPYNVDFVIGHGTFVTEDIYCIPHLHNQATFDAELAKVPKCKVLVLHANLDNHFTKQSDNSLNVSKEVLQTLPVELVYFGHEHSARKLGKAFVGGVQWPTSISDCLDKKDKFAYRLTGTTLEPIKTWCKSSYIELDWREYASNLRDYGGMFVRFVGTATPDESIEVNNLIAKYRSKSKACIVANAVKISDDTDLAKLNIDSLESVTNFNVMDALDSYLNSEDKKVLESLK